MSDRPISTLPPRPQPLKAVSPPRQTGDLAGNSWTPPPISRLEDTGLNLLNLADLVLKVLYFGGYMPGHQIADIIKLPFTGVVDTIMEFLKRSEERRVGKEGRSR